MSNNIIRDVVTRTNGEMYLGVVGSVRSGKSTFIRRFMELKVLPYIQDKNTYDRVLDELPQSSEGKTIMTVEPKFIPSNQMKVTVDADLSLNVRLVDCVGYVIPSAKGYLNEDGTNRLVQTPWFSEGIPFHDAAAIGTRKVIESHSNIGIVMSSDGSFGEFSRDEYEVVEEKIIGELKTLSKPFVLVINTIHPTAPETTNLVEGLKEKYGVEVIALDVTNMTVNDIDQLLKLALDEFDISELNIQVPNWVSILDDSLSYKRAFNDAIAEATGQYRKMKEVFRIQDMLKDTGLFSIVEIGSVDPGTGVVDMEVACDDAVYTNMIEEIIGEKIDDKGHFLEVLQSFIKAKEVYNRVGKAMEKVEAIGYDFALPPAKEMVLETPELIKQSGRYGIKLKATAQAIQLVKINIESTFEPIIGSMEQSQELINHMLSDYETDPDKVWNSEIFGRKLCDVINDGVRAKINAIPDHVQEKFKDSIEKVVNYGKGGIIAIVL